MSQQSPADQVVNLLWRTTRETFLFQPLEHPGLNLLCLQLVLPHLLLCVHCFRVAKGDYGLDLLLLPAYFWALKPPGATLGRPCLLHLIRESHQECGEVRERHTLVASSSPLTLLPFCGQKFMETRSDLFCFLQEKRSITWLLSPLHSGCSPKMVKSS